MLTKTHQIGLGIAIAAGVLLVGKVTLSGPNPPLPPPTGQPPLQNPPMPPPGAKGDGVYVASVDSVPLSSTQAVNVVKLPLPPASPYEIVAKVVVTNDSQDNQASVACALTTTPLAADDASIDYSSVTVPPQGRLPLTLVGTYKYPMSIGVPTLFVACRSSGAASARWTKVVATAVSKIN